MDSKTLYICSTYYHVLISVIKAFQCKDKFDLLITDYVVNGESLAERLKSNNVFNNVYFQGHIDEFEPYSEFTRCIVFHSKNAKKIESQLVLNIKKYSNIYLFHDGIWAANYLKNIRKKYFLIEDSMNSFKHLDCSSFAYLLMRDCPLWKRIPKRIFNIRYTYLDKSPYVKKIEVNDKNGILLNNIRKISEMPRATMFANLSFEQRRTINKIFECDDTANIQDVDILILTQPLVSDRFIPTHEDEITVIKTIIKKFVKTNDSCCIKPHPRDAIEYQNFFPNVKVLNRFTPLEVLSMNGLKCRKCITLFSTAIDSVEAVEKITLFDNSRPWKNQLDDFLREENNK